MKVNLVRFCFAFTAFQSTDLNVETTKAYTYLEVQTYGWKNGARNRTRRFRSFDQIFTYFNKLNIGGFLSDDDYSDAWRLALELRGKYAAMGASHPGWYLGASDSTACKIHAESLLS